MAYQEFKPKQGQTAASYQKQTKNNFTHGLGMEDWTWDKDQGRFLKPGATSAAPKPPAAVSGLQSATPPAATTPAAGAVGAGGGTGDAAATPADSGEGGLTGLLAGIGGGGQAAMPFEPQMGPGLRSGLGQRAYPVRNLALAGLKTVY